MAEAEQIANDTILAFAGRAALALEECGPDLEGVTGSKFGAR